MFLDPMHKRLEYARAERDALRPEVRAFLLGIMILGISDGMTLIMNPDLRDRPAYAFAASILPWPFWGVSCLVAGSLAWLARSDLPISRAKRSSITRAAKLIYSIYCICFAFSIFSLALDGHAANMLAVLKWLFPVGVTVYQLHRPSLVEPKSL